ncbi:MAG TPA: hypothetical protein VNX01_15565 [Bacteroidia bacterium]|nr:hypothetical protein [Bacteroidia bacterium]
MMSCIEKIRDDDELIITYTKRMADANKPKIFYQQLITSCNNRKITNNKHISNSLKKIELLNKRVKIYEKRIRADKESITVFNEKLRLRIKK